MALENHKDTAQLFIPSCGMSTKPELESVLGTKDIVERISRFANRTDSEHFLGLKSSRTFYVHCLLDYRNSLPTKDGLSADSLDAKKICRTRFTVMIGVVSDRCYRKISIMCWCCLISQISVTWPILSVSCPTHARSPLKSHKATKYEKLIISLCYYYPYSTDFWTS